MHQGHPAASAEAPDRRYGRRQGEPANSAPATGRQCRITLAAAPESARRAREFTAATLRSWHRDALIQDAVTIASELVTNAVRHGTADGPDGRAELTWCYQAGRLICVVTDRTSKPPVLAPADPEAESGHGLQIVSTLAVAWGWTMLGTGEKAVWAALELPAPADAADGGHPASTATPAAVPGMRAAGRAADRGHRDPFPAAR